jgi:DNA-binding response OmpR family regulator
MPDAPAADDGLVRGAGETVVVIEDEYGIRATVEEVLVDAGYRVLGASTGAAGLRIVEAEPEVALLITDVGLPGGMNGRQIAEAARRRKPDLKVLFITGYDNAAVSDGNLGAHSAVLTKPFELPALSKRVRAMIEAGG